MMRSNSRPSSAPSQQHNSSWRSKTGTPCEYGLECAYINCRHSHPEGWNVAEARARKGSWSPQPSPSSRPPPREAFRQTQTSPGPSTGSCKSSTGAKPPRSQFSLKFDPSIPAANVQEWRSKYSNIWIAPANGFSGKKMLVAWDIENARPDACAPRIALHPEQIPQLFRDALRVTTGIRQMKVVASLSCTYPPRVDNMPAGVMGPTYQALNSVLNVASGFDVFSAAGKKAVADGQVHKDIGEADDQLKSKVMTWVEQEAELGDVLVLIGGDGGCLKIAMDVPAKGVQVVVIGPVNGTSTRLANTVNHIMFWQDFLSYHARRPSLAEPSQPAMQQMGARLQAQHKQFAEAFSKVKDLDLIITIDVTGSMTNYIEGVKRSVKSLLDEFWSRVPWSKGHMRLGFVGYRDFSDTEQFVTLPLCPLEQSIASADRLVEKLSSVTAEGGGDNAEDVIGGLQQVAALIKADIAGYQHGGQQRTRRTVLFHICDAPNHGSEFHSMAAMTKNNDWFRDGPQCPAAGHDVKVPADRCSSSWTDQARAVLHELRDELGVVNMIIAQVCPERTSKMVAKFKSLLAEDRDGQDTSSGAITNVAVDDGFLTTVAFNSNSETGGSEATVTSIVNQVSRLMLSSTLRTVTTLAAIGYNPTRGLWKNKSHTQAASTVLEVLTEETAEEAEGGAEVAEAALNAGAVASSNPSSSHAAGMPAAEGAADGKVVRFEDGTTYSVSHLKQKEKQIKQKVKLRMQRSGHSIWLNADELELQPPFDVDELNVMISDAARHARTGGTHRVQLLAPIAQQQIVRYLKSPSYAFDGAQKLVYEAVRNSAAVLGAAITGRGATNGDSKMEQLVVMKEFKSEGRFANSRSRYIQAMQSSTVAAFMAQEFLNAATEAGAEVEDLAYLPVVMASYKFTDKGRELTRNHYIEPYIVGKYIKYNSNFGAVNMEVMNNTCHAFSHYSYYATGGRLLVSDVQGVKDHMARKILLTDPVVHCVPDCGEKLFDSDTDQGVHGVYAFFITHQCCNICKQLKLPDALEELADLRTAAKEGRLPDMPGVTVDLNHMD